MAWAFVVAWKGVGCNIAYDCFFFFFSSVCIYVVLPRIRVDRHGFCLAVCLTGCLPVLYMMGSLSLLTVLTLLVLVCVRCPSLCLSILSILPNRPIRMTQIPLRIEKIPHASLEDLDFCCC